MASENSSATLSGLFKQVYGESVENLLPENSILLKEIKFTEKTKTGDKYNQPVVVQRSHGVTYAAYGDGAFTLNTPIAQSTQNAEVRGSQLVLRDRLDYLSAASAMAGGAKAFRSATEHVVLGMAESIAHRLEISMFYGNSGLAVIDGTPVTGAGGTYVLTIEENDWAPGIWSGAENAQIDVYAGSSKVNSNAAVVIESVNMADRKLTVSGNATDLGNIANTDTIYFKGSKGKEMNGLHKILTNTSELFNIDASEYAMWRGNEHAVTGNLTFAKVNDAIAKCVGRGLKEEVLLIVNPDSWSDLLNDQAALRKYDSSYSKSKTENGSEALEFYSANGKIKVLSSIYVKQGHAFIVPPKKVKRIGSSDVTFKNLAGEQGKIFLEMADSAGFEMRCFSDQAILLEAPAQACLITGIGSA